MERLERDNTIKCTGAHVLFGVGGGLTSAFTVLPLMLKALGASELVLGVAFSLATAGWLLLQPLAVFIFGRRTRTKRLLVPWSTAFSIPWVVAIGAVVFLLGRERAALCIGLVVALFAVRVIGEGMVFPFWDDWFAHLFSREFRGRALGLVSGFMALGISVGAVVAGRLQDRLAFPASYAVLFWGAAGVYALAFAGIWWLREPPSLTQAGKRHTVRELVSRFGLSLREANFRNYLIGRIILTLGGGVVGFYAAHFGSPQGGDVAPATVITLGMLITLPQAIFAYLLGRLGDRAGHKSSVVVGACALAASIAVVWLGRGAVACGLGFALLGLAASAGWGPHLNMLYETCPHDSRVAHITLSNLILSPFLLGVPIATGWLREVAGVRAFGFALIPVLIGVLWLAFRVKEPRTIAVVDLDDESLGNNPGQ